jgi:hypothetical protein
MIKAEHQITTEHITMQFNNKWYCFPFIILETEPSFMDIVWAHFGYLSNGQKINSNERTIDEEFLHLLDQGKRAVIYQYLSAAPRNSFIALSNLIWANMDEWQPVLTTCKLYDNAATT